MEYGAYRFRIRDVDLKPMNTVKARSSIGHALAVHIENGDGCSLVGKLSRPGLAHPAATPVMTAN